MAPSNAFEELHLATTGGIPHLVFFLQHLSHELHSLLWPMSHCLGHCTPKSCWLFTCLSHICTTIYSVLIRIQELKKKKKKSVVFPHQWEILHTENIGAIGSSLCIFFLIKVIVTEFFKEHLQSKIKSKPSQR